MSAAPFVQMPVPASSSSAACPPLNLQNRTELDETSEKPCYLPPSGSKVEKSSLRFVFINAGCKFRNVLALQSWILHCEQANQDFDIAYVSEFDGYMRSNVSMTLAGWTVLRHWRQGSRSMAWIIRNTCRPLVVWQKWIGRCGGLVIEGSKQRQS